MLAMCALLIPWDLFAGFKMLRLNIVKLLLPPKSILILNVLSMPKCCCAQILLFGYFGTGKVMLPVILISLAPLSILMQMELTDSSMKRVEVARKEIWLSCHSPCCWLWLPGHFLPAAWGLYIVEVTLMLPCSKASPIHYLASLLEIEEGIKKTGIVRRGFSFCLA